MNARPAPPQRPSPVMAWGRAWLALLFLVSGLAWATAAPGAPGAVPIERIEVRDATGGWQLIDLPDDWRDRGVPRPGQQHYRLVFQAGAEAQPWAIWSSRLPLHHRVWLNGQLLSDTWEQPDALQPRSSPLLLPLPAPRAGSNELLIDARGGMRAGLGRLWLGPAAQVALQAHQHRRIWVDVSRRRPCH